MIDHLDEAVFGIDGVLDYGVEVVPTAGIPHLTISVAVREAKDFPRLADAIRRAVSSLPAVRTACNAGLMALVIRPDGDRLPVSTGTAKRRIQDRRERKPDP